MTISVDVPLAIATALKADVGVAAIVGTRIYVKTLPKNPEWPAVTVSEVDDIADIDSSTSGYAHTRIQCTAWMADYEAGGVMYSGDAIARSLSKTIRNALHKKKNTALTAGTGHVYIVQIRDAGVRPDVNTEISAYLYHRDFMVMYDYKV